MRSRLLLLFAVAAILISQGMPRVSSVQPDSGKAGTEITVTGESLGKATAMKVYVSDGKNDTELTLTAQDDKTIKFKIPNGLKPGRYGLAILTKDAKIIDQPVKLTVD